MINVLKKPLISSRNCFGYLQFFLTTLLDRRIASRSDFSPKFRCFANISGFCQFLKREEKYDYCM
uniref:Uncharacterized protein n=1 Tax=Vitis vinifera TaxID=29760 RepID=F6HIH1_VITVI